MVKQRAVLSDWLPDQAPLAVDASTNVKNVYPVENGYKPIQALAAVSTNSLDSACLGAYSAQDSTGNSLTFAGDSGKLYKLVAGALTDVSQSGGYTIASTEHWEFVQCGQRLLATSISAPLQYYDMNTSLTFDDLAGSPPKARQITVVRDFVVLGNTENSPSQVAWSGFNNSEQWTPGTNQSDVQDLDGQGGWVRSVTGGEIGYIFQERAITRMTYVGPPLIFQFDTVETMRGPISSSVTTKIGSMAYFIGSDGFYRFDGNQSESIGNEKVDRWFFDNLAGNTQTQITVGADPANKLVMWGFVSKDATDTTVPDTLLIYNWGVQKFAYAKVNHEIIYAALSEASTLETIGLQYTTLEEVPVSFDSRVWSGGAFQLSAFDPTHALASFGGDNLEAVLETPEVEVIPGRRALVTNVTPLCDTSSAAVTVRAKNRISDGLTSSTEATMTDSGDCPVLSAGRFHRASIRIPSGTTWTYIIGADIDAEPDGDN